VTAQASDGGPAMTLEAPRPARLPGWAPAAGTGALAAAGLILFFASLRGVHLARMNGLGLLSVLPAGALAGLTLTALAFMLGLALPTAHRAVLGATLAGLVVCLDGITVFLEREPRFPTAYQIAGYVDYVSHTGHTAPGLAAYFSWPGFFALISFVTGAAGIHGLLTVMRLWPMTIDLLCLPPLFLLMRNLRLSWRARWLAGFLFAVGNWVGQDYFSPQSFGYLLYIVFLAVLVNWFLPASIGVPRQQTARRWPGRLDRRLFGVLEPGEKPSREASPAERGFLLAMLIAVFTVTTIAHQLTPFFMIGACLALVVVRRCSLTGLPVLLAVILAGWVSFEAVGFWYGHLSTIFGGLGDLGVNVTSSVGGRLTGSTPTHLLALHAREGVTAVIVGLAAAGALRRRRRGLDDRVLLVLLAVPLLMVAVQSYGGEIALRIYLFMLPAACVLAASAFFPGPSRAGVGRAGVGRARVGGAGVGRARPGRPTVPVLAGLVACALVLPAGFYLARYGNEAFEQTPAGELAATNWVYAHDADGSRLLWLSESPQTDVTPQMPWAYTDVSKLLYVPTLAPRDPADVAGAVAALRAAGPGSYLITTQTEVASLQQTASYPAGWGQRFETAMSAAKGVRVAYADGSAVVYTLHWPRGTPHRPLGLDVFGPTLPSSPWNVVAVVLLWAVLALLTACEFIRVYRPGSRLVRRCTLASLPLLTLLVTAILLRFVLR
jgi:hypothetical protein